MDLHVCQLGLIEYDRAFELQLRLVERLCAHAAADESPREGYLLLLAHPPTFTIGRSGSDANVLAAPEQLEAAGARVLHVNRGGDVTFHGPGQVVAYPIVPLERRDVHRYLRQLEEAIIRTLAHYGIDGHRDDANTGVWVGRDKLAAIGVAIRRWIAYHGIAINVVTDLSYFDMIVPCGVHGRGVTSMSLLLGRDVATEDVAERFSDEFASVFGMTPRPAALEALTSDF